MVWCVVRDVLGSSAHVPSYFFTRDQNTKIHVFGVCLKITPVFHADSPHFFFLFLKMMMLLSVLNTKCLQMMLTTWLYIEVIIFKFTAYYITSYRHLIIISSVTSLLCKAHFCFDEWNVLFKKSTWQGKRSVYGDTYVAYYVYLLCTTFRVKCIFHCNINFFVNHTLAIK